MGDNCMINYLELSTYAIMNIVKPKILQLLQQDNADLEGINENGDTVLHFVLKHTSIFSETEIIEFLNTFINRGGDIKVKNNEQETVLHLAIDKQLKHVANFLMRHIAYIDTVDDKGNSITHYFVRKFDKYQKDSLNFIELLLSKGFSFDEKNENGQSALHLAIEYNLHHILPTLLKHTNDINFVSEEGQQTLLQLFLSASYGEYRNFCGLLKYLNRDSHQQPIPIEIVNILLDRGVSVDHEDRDGLTALHIAIRFEEQELVDMLIDRITKVTGKFGNKLLNEVIKKAAWGYLHEGYYLKILLDLTAKGADVNLEDDQGATPWYHAIKHKNLLAIKFMMKNCFVNFRVKMHNGNGLLHALTETNRGCPEFQRYLCGIFVSEGCDVNAKNNAGQTPLHLAANNNIAVVQQLIAHEADVNCRDSEGLSPLHVAARRGLDNIAESLLHNGAKINGRDRSGETPLHAAAVGAYKRDFIQMLLERGAEVNARDHRGDTALVKALRCAHNIAVEVLLMYGADVMDFSVIRVTLQCETRWACSVYWRHCIKVKAAGLPYPRSYDPFTKVETYQQLYDDCSREIEVLKNTTIDSRRSLYDWMHMEPDRRYIYNDELRRIAACPKMEKKFPHYFSVILNIHRETVGRKALLESAKEAWLELTEIHLPNICLERILAYLNTGDLFGMTEGLSEVFD